MPAKKSPGNLPYIQSLDRGLAILQTVANSRHPVPLNDLSDLLGIDRSSAFRLAQTLRRRGFLAYPSDKKDYILGSAMWTLSHYYDWGLTLVRIAHSELKAMATQMNETAHLAIREGNRALFIDSAHASQIIAVSGQAGELVPLYATAHGKALLADCKTDELERIFGTGNLERFTDSTITNIPSLAQECIAIKQRGYATDEGEFQEGMRCVAAPIRISAGAIAGSIGISAPSNRFLKAHYPLHSRQVVRVAQRISNLLDAAEPFEN